MSYRDERDALRGRIENLEEDLREATKALEAQLNNETEARVAELEQQIAQAQELLQEAKRDIAVIKGSAPSENAARGGGEQAPALDRIGPFFFGAGRAIGRAIRRLQKADPKAKQAALVGGSMLILATVAMAVTFTWQHARSTLRTQEEPHAAPTVPATQVTQAPKPAEPPTVPPPMPLPEVVAPAPPSPERTVTATWSARSRHAIGSSGVAPGAACTITASLASKGDTIDVQSFEVHCGTKVLYRSSDSLEGMSMFSRNVMEELGEADGTTRYVIGYKDTGSRGGPRTQVSLVNTAGEVWSDNPPSFRVALTLALYSTIATGGPLLDTSRKGFREAYTVQDASAGAPLKVGALCKVTATPLDGEKRCLVRLSCAGKVLFQGEAHCTVGAEGILTAVDPDPTSKDTDPAIDLDVPKGTLVINDDAHRRVWRATLERSRGSAQPTQ